MAGEGPRLAVRPYLPADYLEVRRVLAEGLMSLPPLAFRRALLSPVAPSLLLATGGAVYRASHSPALATLSICGLLALLYLTCWEVYACYLRERLVDDMADIEGRYLGQEGAGFWVAEVEGMEGLGGVVAALPREGEGGCCELLRLSVDRRCRRLGVGRRLTAWVLDFARARGYRVCVLETSSAQQPAVRLYRSLGFRLVRWDQPVPHPPLASRLTNVYLWEMRRALEEGEGGEGRGETL